MKTDNLYRQCIDSGFHAIGNEAAGDRIQNAAGFTLAKEEGSVLCMVQALDFRILEKDIGLFLQQKEIERANALEPLYGSVWLVLLCIGESLPAFASNAEAYFGQSPYIIYWHINPDTGVISIPKGQPDDVLGLKEAVISSFSDTGSFITETDDPTEADIDIKHHSPPVSTCILVGINILITLLMFLNNYTSYPVLTAIRFGAIVPSLIIDHGEYYRLLTAMFVHFGIAHLSFNIAGILIFGTRIEKYFGRFIFITVYFISGLSASVASLLFTRGVSAGASGAVYGLLGAAFIFTKYTKKPMDVINHQIIVIYIIMGLGMGFIVPNIDHFGHIGGLAAGLIIGITAVRFKLYEN